MPFSNALPSVVAGGSSMYLFVAPTPFLRGETLHQQLCRGLASCPQTRKSQACRTTMSGRSPWPLKRFLKTALFYSPLGKFMRGTQTDPSAELSARARKLTTPMRTAVYLVTGASGGCGRRVVRNLLRSSKKVRALTRDRDRLVDSLLKVGIDAEEEEKKGTLEIFLSDLYNVQDDLFKDVVAMASCTGTKIGPQNDPDRSKYFQGVKFYTPVVLEDTPENVEYRGFKNLVSVAIKHFEGVGVGGIETLPVLEFTDPHKVTAQWGLLDDVVMGGVSQSNLRVQGPELLFSGNVSTDNNGGFVSARTVSFDTPMDLSEYDGIDLKIKGDGQSYKLIIRCEQKWDGINHCYTFPTMEQTLEEVRVPFSEFKAVFRAKTVTDGSKLDPKSVFAFQIMLSKFEYDGKLNANFKPGPFELRIVSLSAYKESGGRKLPKVVHIGTAAVTRVFRSEELTEKVPLVEMNEKIGRLFNWKLAGEDCLRTSGIPYCIIRPTALTEEEKYGLDRLTFDQGDNLTGKVGRDDISDLIVEAFSTPSLTNKTFEIALADETKELSPAHERWEQLEVDNMEDRTFASFPYVPDEEPPATMKN